MTTVGIRLQGVRLSIADNATTEGTGTCSNQRRWRDDLAPRTQPMISFVWSPHEYIPAGTGGSENYTVGQVRELNRRGIGAQVVTIGLGTADGRSGFVGVPFLSLGTISEISQLEGTVVFVTAFPEVSTRQPSYQMLHVPPPKRPREQRNFINQIRGRELIATSRFAARLWSNFLAVDLEVVSVVHPFAEPCFAREPRPHSEPQSVRILFAGRLSPEKGIYTLLAMLHNEVITDLIDDGVHLSFTVTTAGADKPQGKIIETLLEVHPGISLVDARQSPQAVAALMAEHDIVIMPSNSQYWRETFGIVSVESQHAGCRVVASDDGGLPETDCGSLGLVVADDAAALAHGIRNAVNLGAVTERSRRLAASRFTVEQSVDELLSVLNRHRQALAVPEPIFTVGTHHVVPSKTTIPFGTLATGWPIRIPKTTKVRSAP